MTEQPGYDVLAEAYAARFPDPYLRPLERHAVRAFAAAVRETGLPGPVVDIGCGTGGVAADLAEQGLAVVAVEPSARMLEIATATHAATPVRWVRDDARLGASGLEGVAAIIARFSLIHVPPAQVPAVLERWADLLPDGGLVLVAFQCLDDSPSAAVPEPWVEWSHQVARAWRWHPTALAAAFAAAGFREEWRAVSRPDEDHRFPEAHLQLRREC
ncbi:class I SAM-dependent methyltransferase [Nocardioides pantholopis]|uniref:class I SAM-dependent methyltransferase n=1 Tax=Nocardioides pantholopis TaxID=2483798 RepID=UPI000F09109A|nr:class I SAM-dependent methyltransferase [Nocardioides pantholopis]